MRYAGMPLGMWVLFAGSFRKHLSSIYGYDPEMASVITAKAKPKYKEIIGRLPEFEKADRFKMNIVNCALLSAFLLNLPERPTVETTTEYYVTHRECGVCKIGQQEGLAFLTPHMCVMDYPTIEYKGGKLLRTKTLGAGGDCCDFHVVKGAQ